MLYASTPETVTTSGGGGGGGGVQNLAVVYTPAEQSITAQFSQYPNPLYTHFAFDLLDAENAIIGGTGVKTTAQHGLALAQVNSGYEWQLTLDGLAAGTQYRCRIRVGDEPF
jgi:hypothetical protein